MPSSAYLQRQLGLIIWAVGLFAVSSLLLAPLEILKPPTVNMSATAFRGFILINPLLLVTAAVALGSWLAPSVRLDAPLIRSLLVGSGAGVVLRRQIIPALVVGVITAAILDGYSVISAPWFAATKLPDVPMPLVTKVLYGGIVEEIMTRWGVMTLFVWCGWRLSRRPGPISPALYVLGASLAALVFGAGHLPLLFVIMPSPPFALIIAVVFGNAVPGLLFGLLFWLRGLEAAMIAHALGHLIFTLATAV